MLLSQLHDFLLASAGSSASFIGLLYVALTVVKERTKNDGLVPLRDRVIAESAYIALVTVFFISMVGLLPNVNLSWVIMIFGITGAMQSARMSMRVKAQGEHIDNRTLVFGLAIIYGFIAAYGAYLTFTAAQLDPGIFYSILFTLYGIGLGRAWTLVGLGRS